MVATIFTRSMNRGERFRSTAIWSKNASGDRAFTRLPNNRRTRNPGLSPVIGARGLRGAAERRPHPIAGMCGFRGFRHRRIFREWPKQPCYGFPRQCAFLRQGAAARDTPNEPQTRMNRKQRRADVTKKPTRQSRLATSEVDQTLLRAQEHHDAGRLAEAESSMEGSWQGIRIMSWRSILSVLLRPRSGNLGPAQDLITTALDIKPNPAHP